MSQEKYSTLDEQLKNEGWRATALIKHEHLTEGVIRSALDFERGKYDDFMIVPASLAIKGHPDMVPEGREHVVYAKLSKDYMKKIAQKKSVFLLMLECESKETGERLYYQF